MTLKTASTFEEMDALFPEIWDGFKWDSETPLIDHRNGLVNAKHLFGLITEIAGVLNGDGIGRYAIYELLPEALFAEFDGDPSRPFADAACRFAAANLGDINQIEVRDNEHFVRLMTGITYDYEDENVFRSSYEDELAELMALKFNQIDGEQTPFSHELTYGADDIPDIEWLVDGLIPKSAGGESKIGFLYGNSSTFKSFIAAGIAAAVANGDEFAGMPAKKAKVMYVSGEDSVGVRIRLISILGDLKRYDNLITNAHDMRIGGQDNNSRMFGSVAKTFKPDLIIMDTMNSLGLCMNNNSSADVSDMMERIKKLNCTCLVIHHSNKEGKFMEGSHALFSNADFVMMTELKEKDSHKDAGERVSLICKKVKNGAYFPDVDLEMVPFTIHRNRGRDVSTLVAKLANEVAALRVDKPNDFHVEVLEIIGGSDELMKKSDIHNLTSKRLQDPIATQRALSELVDSGLIKRVGRGSATTYAISNDAGGDF